MEVVKIKTIDIDNKLKKIYSKIDTYIDLPETTQNLFDLIFPILWIKGETTLPNKDMAKKTGLAVSTIEKMLRRLDRAELITRKLIRKYDDEIGWISERTIVLDEFFKTYMMKQLNIVPEELTNNKEPPVPAAPPAKKAEEKPVGTAKFKFGRKH